MVERSPDLPANGCAMKHWQAGEAGVDMLSLKSNLIPSWCRVSSVVERSPEEAGVVSSILTLGTRRAEEPLL